MAKYPFKYGYYYMAGVDKPFIVSTDMIVDKVEDMGFKVWLIGECEKWGDRGRMPFPTNGTTCGDEYDWVGFVERLGPDTMIDLPSQVKWIRGWPSPKLLPPPQQPPPQSGPPSPWPTPQPPAPQPQWEQPPPYVPPAKTEEPIDVSGIKIGWQLPAVAVGSIAGVLLARWWRSRK